MSSINIRNNDVFFTREARKFKIYSVLAVAINEISFENNKPCIKKLQALIQNLQSNNHNPLDE